MDNEVLLMLGRIEGKLDTAITSAEQHRQDDIRRFTEVYEKLDDHEKDINQAKGAKGVIVWLIGGGLASLGASLWALAKAFGKA